MFFYLSTLSIGLLVNTINFPFDRGANIRGSDRAPELINRDLDFLNIVDNYTIASERNHLRTVLGDGYFHVWNTLDRGIFPLIIGGDHTISASTISTCNDYSIMKKQHMGILWCSAFADFNTIETSQTGFLHGVTVSILCRHTLPMLSFGEGLQPNQFGFYGLRDLDSCEFKRFTDYNMCMLESINNLEGWLDTFDKIYLSLSLDVLNPDEFNYVNTPIPNGVTCIELKDVLQSLKKSEKLIAMDIVEFNPNKGENITIISDLIRTALV